MNSADLPITPAGRLSFWFGRAAAYAGAHVSEARVPGSPRRGRHWRATDDFLQPSNALFGWCSIWALDVTTVVGRAECYRRGMSLVGEGVEVRRAAEAGALEDPRLAAALEHFEKVERSLSYFTSLRSTVMTHMTKHLRQPVWDALDSLDLFLRQGACESPTTAEAINDLIRRTEDTIASVAQATDLDSEHREELLTRLRAVKDSLERFGVTGPAELAATVDSTMGLMMRLYLRGVDVSRHPATRATLALIAAAALLLGMGADYAQISGSPLGRMLDIPNLPIQDIP